MLSNAKAKWAEALSSGKYRPGFNYELRRQVSVYNLPKEYAYCVLGVLCDVYCKENKCTWDEMITSDENYGSQYVIPRVVQLWAGFEDTHNPKVRYNNKPYFVSNLNDELRLPFAEIAAIIKAQL